MSKEFKLVFDEPFRKGDIIVEIEDMTSDFHYLCNEKGDFLHIGKKERDDHNFIVGGIYGLVGWEVPENGNYIREKLTRTLIKVL